MKLKIAGRQEKQEPVVELRLEQSEAGEGVYLYAKQDGKGERVLMGIFCDGSFRRYYASSSELGFNAHPDGRLKFYDER